MRPPRASRRRTSTDRSPEHDKGGVVGPSGSGAGHTHASQLAARGRDMHLKAYSAGGGGGSAGHDAGYGAPSAGRAGAGAGAGVGAVDPVAAAAAAAGAGDDEAAAGGTWQDALFSPVLKFFGADGEVEGEAVVESKVKEVADVSTPTTPAGTSSGSSDGSTRTTVSGDRRMPSHTPSYTPPHGHAGASRAGASAAAAAEEEEDERDVPACSLASPALYTRKRDFDDRGSDIEGEDGGYGAAYGTGAGGGSGAEVGDSPMSGEEGAAGDAAAAAGTPETHGTADVSAGGEGEGEGEEEDEFEEFNPYLFIKYLPAYREVCPVGRPLCLPKKTRHAPRLSLVLDLDETLVHCSVEAIPDADLTFPVEFNGVNYQVYVRKRPYLDHFLAAVADRYEVTVFTASQKVYAERLLNLIDPHRRLVKFRLFRDSCLNVDGNYLKDLTVLGRDLRSTVLVDNSPHAFGYQVDNGIPIESWFEDKSDTELLKLMGFLQTLEEVPDVRTAVRDKFQVHRLISAAT